MDYFAGLDVSVKDMSVRIVDEKRTWHSHPSMSAFRGIADIGPCLLYPQKQTSELGREMSAMCQKRTFVTPDRAVRELEATGSRGNAL